MFSVSEGLYIVTKKTPFWEDAVIIISIFTLWPAVIRRETALTKVIMIIALGLLIWIFIRRLGRMKKVSR